MKTYSELISLESFEDRFDYLKLNNKVGEDTFGFDRYLNQIFYKSKEWKDLRAHIITRDEACDLGVPGFDIFSRIVIHHMNPITVEDVLHNKDYILNPEYLITVSNNTHQALHYGDDKLLRRNPKKRYKNDTKLW